MSCSLSTVSCIQDITQVEDFLDELHQEYQSIIDKGFYGESWRQDDWSGNESTNELNTESPISVTKSKKCWLHDCLISLSPSEELLVAAKKTNLLILSKKWGKNEDENPVYEKMWCGSLNTGEIKDDITALLCAPLSSQKRSSEGNPDWTCIMVGFSSGILSFYLNNGKQVLSQHLHEGPLRSIKLKTENGLFLKKHEEHVDELIVLYSNAIVVIDGFSLLQSLRVCRNQLAKAQASYQSGPMVPPPLAYRKWRIDDHDEVKDIASCSIVEPCLFDRMQSASLQDGPQTSLKGAAPAFHRFMTTGKEPFLGVYHASERGSPPIISEVVMAVANKLTSTVFSKLTTASGWLMGGGKPQQQQSLHQQPYSGVKKKVEPGDNLQPSFVLKDKHRETETILLAPLGNLAVVTDGFNRVMLFDTSKGIFIRIWKGYREAQCGWIVVEDENVNDEIRRKALFLVIYAPKRGIIEIYLMENGTRVGAFSVGKNCRLLYQGYGSLGPSILTGVRVNSVNQCSLLCMDGTMKVIHVPFHCASSSSHSTQSRDLHLLKKIRLLMEKNMNSDNREEICDLLEGIMLEIEVPSTKRKVVDCILSSRNVDGLLLKDILQTFITDLEKAANCGKEEDKEYYIEICFIICYCHAYKDLVETYLAIQDLHSIGGGDDFKSTQQNDNHSLANLLHISLSEATSFSCAIENYVKSCLLERSIKKTMVTTSRFDRLSVKSFLSCFDIFITQNDSIDNRRGQLPSQWRCQCQIKKILTEEQISNLGSMLFEGSLKGEIPVRKLTLILESSRIPPKQLIAALATYYQLDASRDILSQICFLHSLVSCLCIIKGGNESEMVDHPVGKVSTWWQKVRDILSQSVLIAHCLVMAVVCRSVAMEMTAATQKIKVKDESDIASMGWEAVTMDMEMWNLLIMQLEHLLELDVFVHSNHQLQQMTGVAFPTFLPHYHGRTERELEANGKSQTSTGKSVSRMPVFSVKGVLDAGCGAFAQIVADCLVRQSVPGFCLGKLKTNICTETEGEDYEDDLPVEANNSQQLPILNSLCKLRELFPHSLEQDVLWANCAWECLMYWNEDVEEVGILSSGLIHLSCIHNQLLQQGLGLMMWKTVFYESIKTLLGLIDKVGKSPKERLCKQNIGFSKSAIVEFLANAKQLLDILGRVGVDIDEVTFEINTESLWVREKSSEISIVEQAIEQPLCSEQLITHHWCLVVVLYLIMYGDLRSIKPSQLFDTKGRQAFMLPLHGMAHLSNELDDRIMKSREEFCENAAKAIIKATNEDDDNHSEILHYLSLVVSLSKVFCVDDDRLRRKIALELYRKGLDILAKEIFVYIVDKGTFISQMFAILRHRINSCLLPSDKITDNVSKLPTNISTWLQNEDIEGQSIENTDGVTLADTYRLLQQLLANAAPTSKEYCFLNELSEALKIFL